MTQLKWYQIRRVRLTREYLGGILAGLGGGVMFMWSVNVPNLQTGWATFAILGGPLLITIGSTLAWHAQAEQKDKDEPEDRD